MKKSIFLSVFVITMLNSCGTYTGTGTYIGASFGSILGSAIGGIAGGPRGSDMGTIVGMAGGAIIGAKIGAEADERRAEDMDQYRRDRMGRRSSKMNKSNVPRTFNDSGHNSYSMSGQAYNGNKTSALLGDTLLVPADSTYGSGFDASHNGDDRLYDFDGIDYSGNHQAQQSQPTMFMQSAVSGSIPTLKYNADIEIRNARFVDENQDGKLQRGELCEIVFDIINHGTQPLVDIVPTVVEATGNRHIYISPNMHVEKIMPGKGIRYTALVKADKGLKNGMARFCVSAVQGGVFVSKVSEFRIPCVR